MQQLLVEIAVPVPADYVLVSKVQYDELKEQSLSGEYWTMQDLEKKVKKKREWIQDKILYPAKFRKELDSDNGGFVYYPKSKSEQWSFAAVEMSKFLDKNFSKIYSGK
ncbi:DUF771 domain-containing protein [Metasolibacillus meyeri]|uniref:DUF771 domain-containing protein n=1 Tax=Metasolibacillus meyeri TaxID=1071052 RepID=UPI000D301004|nr:DUF771 domain-containing protein [Metasolibacillus meyeri]